MPPSLDPSLAVVSTACQVADNFERMMKRRPGKATRSDARALLRLVRAVRKLRAHLAETT